MTTVRGVENIILNYLDFQRNVPITLGLVDVYSSGSDWGHKIDFIYGNCRAKAKDFSQKLKLVNTYEQEQKSTLIR